MQPTEAAPQARTAHPLTSETVRMLDLMEAQARGYVQGHQDATGPDAKDTGASIDFGRAYRAHAENYAREWTGTRENIRTAYGYWLMGRPLDKIAADEAATAAQDGPAPAGDHRPHAWADGYGVWHVRVTTGCASPLLAARRALRDELTQRDAGVAREVWLMPVRVPALDTPGTVVYREGDPPR